MTTQPTVQVDVKQLVKEITGVLSKQLKGLEDGTPQITQTILTQTAILAFLLDHSVQNLSSEEVEEVERLRDVVSEVELTDEEIDS